MPFWGFDHRAHRGSLVVSRDVVPAVTAAFRSLYATRFPMHRMTPIARYGGSDTRSMAHDNTSAFNCRYAVADGPKHWSEHAFGEAVDLDPRENPYSLDGRIRPASGAAYADRTHPKPGMILADGSAVHAFAEVGWGWGGRWSGTPDYQHFSRSGH